MFRGEMNFACVEEKFGRFLEREVKEYRHLSQNLKKKFIRNDKKTASSTRSFLIFTPFLVPKMYQKFLEFNFYGTILKREKVTNYTFYFS